MGEGCTLDPEDQAWGPVYTCSRCCHVQWTSFLYVVWAVIYQVQGGFRLLEIAVAAVIDFNTNTVTTLPVLAYTITNIW